MLKTIPHEEYNSKVALRSSTFKEFLVSPLAYKLKCSQEYNPTDSMELGTLIHMAVLEPQLFAENVKIIPDVDLRTKAGKEEKLLFLNNLKKGQTACTIDQWTTANNIAISCKRHKKLQSILKDALIEKSGFWKERNINCKFRADIISSDGAIYDLKSTNGSALNPYFGYEAKKYGYVFSLAFYGLGYKACVGMEPTAYKLIAVEKNGACGVKIHNIPMSKIVAMQARILNMLDVLHECEFTQKYPSYDESEEELFIPENDNF